MNGNPLQHKAYFVDKFKTMLSSDRKDSPMMMKNGGDFIEKLTGFPPPASQVLGKSVISNPDSITGVEFSDVSDHDCDAAPSWNEFIARYAQGFYLNHIPPQPPSPDSYSSDDRSAESPNRRMEYFPAPYPANEELRQRALYRYRILQSEPEVMFDRIAYLVRHLFDAHACYISLVDKETTWYKTEVGFSQVCLDRDVSLCTHAVLSPEGDPLVVLDTLKDWRFAKNPQVVSEPYIRFYAGAPLRTSDGFNIGVLCAVDTRPRDEFTIEQRRQLRDFADMVMHQIDLVSNTLRLRIHNRMQVSITEFTRTCCENNKLQFTMGSPEILSPDSVCMRREHRLACRLIHETLQVDAALVIELLPAEPLPEHHRLHQAVSANKICVGRPSTLEQSSEIHSVTAVGLDDQEYRSRTSIRQEVERLLRDAHVMENIVAAENSSVYIYQNNLPPSSGYASAIVVGLHSPKAHCSTLAECTLAASTNPDALIVVLTKDTKRVFEESDSLYLMNFAAAVMNEHIKKGVIAADLAKTAFISSVSHEFRTPLHGILALLELLLPPDAPQHRPPISPETTDPNLSPTLQDNVSGFDPLTPNQQNLLRTIESCGRSLTSIVNNVLEFARLEHRRVVPHEEGENVNLVRLCEEIGESMGSLVDQNVEFVVSVEGDRGEKDWETAWTVKSVGGILRQILVNLLGNAFKFTTSGTIELSLSRPTVTSPATTPMEADPSVATLRLQRTLPSSTSSSTSSNPYKLAKIPIVLTVSDTGKGISRNFLQTRLFQPFAQEDPLAPGTGLGLSIVRLLVDKLEGRVEVESREGHGSVFRVYLWCEEADTEETDVKEGSAAVAEEEEVAVVDTNVEIGEGKGLSASNEGHGDKSKDRPCPLTIKMPAACQASPHGRARLLVPQERRLGQILKEYLGEWCGLEVVTGEPKGEHTRDDLVVAEYGPELIRCLTTSRTRAVVITPISELGQAASEIAEARRRGFQAPVELVGKPVGPLKLLRAVQQCFSAPDPTENAESEGVELDDPRGEDAESGGGQGRKKHPLERLNLQTNGRSLSSQSLISTPTLEAGSPFSPTPTSASPTTPPYVLVVEDNSVNRMILANFLKKRGVPFEEAENGLRGVEIFKQRQDDGRRFDVVLMDINMPVMDGNKATQEMRHLERETGHRTTIIALTGLASDHDRRFAYDCGMDEFLTKPVSLVRLADILKSNFA
ncbi:uncharacterized protein VTP21DRAFT_11480 [Calcarisporiella thermophila]|uniref:uncharacterized protein n=1 Tax=Calcarisporiella thermophila TaxID=911321 RepID=UPI003743DD14